MYTVRKLILAFIITHSTCCTVLAQVGVLFNPMLQSSGLEGLSQVQISNAFSINLKARLTITIREQKAGLIVSIRTGVFDLPAGTHTIPRNVIAQAQFRFANNATALVFQNTRRLADGEYEYCFEVDITESKQPQLPPYFENCFQYEHAATTPLLLLLPAEESEQCDKRPTFNWQPSLPIMPQGVHRLTLVAVQEGQTAAEAIANNIPLILQRHIPGNSLLFPYHAPSLKENQEYAWQVTLFSGNMLLKKSDIWTFRIRCENPYTPLENDTYRELKENVEGDFYVVNEVLKFSFQNPYNPGVLDYSIENISSRSGFVKQLPPLLLTAGLNKQELNLTELKELKKGDEYILTVKLVNSRKYVLRFIYNPDK